MTYIPQPVALRLAEMLEQGARLLLKQRSVAAAGELRRQHTRIAELEREVVHTDGLLEKANTLARIRAPHIAELEAQLSSSGFTAADMATAAAQGFRDGVASVAASAGSEPVAIDREALIDAIAQGLHGTWHCTRVWEAWHVGTMSEDDFEPVDESETPAELADAVLALLTHPSPPEGMVAEQALRKVLSVVQRTDNQLKERKCGSGNTPSK